MKSTIARYPLWSFFIMAFVFSWVAVAPLILNRGLPVEPFQIAGALAGPTLAAVIVLAVTDGRSGLAAFFKRYLHWKAGILWWLIVLFGVLLSLTLGAALLLGISVITEFANNLVLILVTYLITLVVGVILGPLWEEPGWRGFALPRLQARLGPVLASVVLGALWAGWHAPGYAGGWMQSNALALLLYCIAFSVCATWIYNHTGGSILLMILFHSSSNAAISIGARVLPANLSPEMNALVFGGWIPALVGIVAAIVVLAITKGSLGYRGAAKDAQASESTARGWA